MRKKKRLHFVYSVPKSSFSHRKVNGVPLYRKFWKYVLRWPEPVFAPFSITYHVLQHLSSDYDILLYDLDEKTPIELKPNDLFIGHVWPDFNTKEKDRNKWGSYDAQQVTNRTILKYPGDKRVFAIGPFNHSMEQLEWSIPLLEKVSHYIGICGDFWFSNLERSDFTFLRGKFSFLNMPIDITQYPRVKRRFNEKGKRKFLYIGRISKEKNTDMLEHIAAQSKYFTGGYIGEGKLKGWKQISTHASLTPEFMSKLAEEYDFFLTASSFDAQATTILEAMSWGFVVACTPESGYTEKSIYQLSVNNAEHNVQLLEKLQYSDDSFLEAIVQENDILLKQKYTWSVFTNKLRNILNYESVQTN